LQGATIFTHTVRDPERYGIATFGERGAITKIIEKPIVPESDQAITGLYFYDENAPELAKKIEPSARGELEITALNEIYLASGMLFAEKLGPGFAWFDAGTPESLLEASNFIRIVEERLGLQIGCIEEICLKNGWITSAELEQIAAGMGKNSYANYLIAASRRSSK
jgi:glucose-1-phosphate thymidylyltransferase